MTKLKDVQNYFKDKVVLELGAGFGIPSLVALNLGAKYVYVTDGNDDVLSILPVIFNKNHVPSNKYTTKKLLFNQWDDLRGIVDDCRNNVKQANIDIILASDVLDTKTNAANFFDTVKFYFDVYKEQQRKKFRKRKQKEFENKVLTPNVQQQFNRFTSNKVMFGDIKKPVTNGGVLPCLLKPSPRNCPAIPFPPSPNNLNTDTSINSHSSHSDDDNGSRSTIFSNKNMQNVELPNTTHVNPSSMALDYKTPYIVPGSSLSAIKTVAEVEELRISRFNRYQYDQFNQRNIQAQQKKPLIPKYDFNKQAADELADSDGDQEMYERVKKRSENSNNHNINGHNQSQKNFDEKEEEEFISKQKVNAPMLILAHHKKNRKKDVKLSEDGFQQFFNKCVAAGYRTQNIVFEWDYEIWMIKA